MSEENWRQTLGKKPEYYEDNSDNSDAEDTGANPKDPSNAAASDTNISCAISNSNKEWQLISHLVQDIHKEKVRSRRWGVLFKSLTFFIVLFFIFNAWQDDAISVVVSEDHVAVIKLNGVISHDSPASAKNILANIERAFEQESAKAIVLDINSPGGSPVQAGIIYDEIMRFKGRYPDKPVYASITDMGTSGAYYVAVAADTIYADKASLVGSIGVIASGFGFTDLINTVGIERRTYIAGSNKDFLDPFKPEKPQQKQDMDTILQHVHQQFISIVKDSRGDRLVDDGDIFSGLFWAGEQALELGLIDNIGSIYDLRREKADELPLQVYRSPKTPYQEIIEQLGVVVSHKITSYLSQPNLH